MKTMMFAAALVLALPAVGASAAEPAAAVPVVIAAPAAGASQVVFYRPSAMGMAISCNIREDGKMLGTTNNGRYFVLATTPGPHKYTAHGETTDVLNVETEADATTYVRCKIMMGVMSGRPNLSPSSKEEYEGRSSGLKPSDPEKMAKAIAADEVKLAKVQ